MPGLIRPLPIVGFAISCFLLEAIGPSRILADDSAESKFRSVVRRVEAANLEFQEAFGVPDLGERVAAFRKVELAYASLLAEQGDSESFIEFEAELYVSWGNAAVLSGNKGIAILAFRRALLVDPYHQKAQKNLAFVRSQLPAWTQDDSANQSKLNYLFIWKNWFDSPTIHWIAASAFAFGSILLGIAILKRTAGWGYYSLIPFLVWLILFASTMVRVENPDANTAVFIAEETLAFTADSPNSSLSFDSPIPAGTEVKIIEARDQWTSVEFRNGDSGWVRNSSIERVEPSKE